MSYKKLKEKFEEHKREKGIETMSKEALCWFHDYTKQFAKSASFTKTTKSGTIVKKPVPGRFYLYLYNPKTKEQMPYYDSMPLVLITKVVPGGWFGINFHYMPPDIRLRIMEGFYNTIKDPTLSSGVKLKSNWRRAASVAKAAASHHYLQHSIKRYLSNHISSPLLEIDPEYWAMCIFLPLSRFKKKQTGFVWNNV